MDAPGSETRPPAGDIRAGTRRLLIAFAVLTALALVQLLVLSDVADRLWAWTIQTELTAAFLGAAYGAGFVLSVLSLRQREWSRIRGPVITVTAFTWFTAIATGIHLHRLHLTAGGPVAQGAAWLWLAVYLVIPPVALAVLIRQERDRSGREAVQRPMPDWLTVVLAVEGAVLLAAGVVLFAGGLMVHHQEPAARFWPWVLMPLGAQVIGAWLMALGLAAGLAIAQRDLRRLLVQAVTFTAFGVFQAVAVIWYWPQVDRHDASLWIYLAGLAAVICTGAYGWWAAEQGRPHPVTTGDPPGTGEPVTAGPRTPGGR